MKKFKLIAIFILISVCLCSCASANDSVTMYAPDGRTINIHSSEVEAYQNVGWSIYSFVTVDMAEELIYKYIVDSHVEEYGEDWEDTYVEFIQGYYGGEEKIFGTYNSSNLNKKVVVGVNRPEYKIESDSNYLFIVGMGIYNIDELTNEPLNIGEGWGSMYKVNKYTGETKYLPEYNGHEGFLILRHEPIENYPELIEFVPYGFYDVFSIYN